MLRIAICEDSPQQTRVILTLLAKYKDIRSDIYIQPHTFCSGYELMDSLEIGKVFDLFLLDILMPGLNGIELAHKIRARDADVPLVFLTSSTDYALEAFNVSAVQYILKPIKVDALFSVLDKIIFKLRREEERFLLVATPEHNVKVAFSSIIYVESMQHTLYVYLENGDKLQSKTIRVCFEEAIARLLEDDRFLHAHKSFVLNMEHVEKMTRNSFVMKDGIEISVPRYKYVNAKSRYLDYLSACGVGLIGGTRQS